MVLESELERGGACAFIGVTHCPGVLSRLRRSGYEVAPLAAV